MNSTVFGARLTSGIAVGVSVVLCACNPWLGGASQSLPSTGVEKIQHIVVIMQENRSFDSYFGTYPGADGIPMQNGVPTVCLDDPLLAKCVRPYHNAKDINHGGPHDADAAIRDIDNGRMDGFIREQKLGQTIACPTGREPSCDEPDVMGWHDPREIPNYWTYAQQFVLQDHLFEPTASWSLASHLFMVSAWSASCAAKGDSSSCHSSIQVPPLPPDYQAQFTRQQRGGASITQPDYAWTDLTYLLLEPRRPLLLPRRSTRSARHGWPSG